MKKRTVTKLLSCALAFSVAATAMPVTTWANKVPAAEESLEGAEDETAVQEGAEDVKENTEAAGQETTETVANPDDSNNVESDVVEGEQEVVAPEPEESIGRSIPVDGKNDEWTQDPDTVIGDDAVNDMVNGYRHFKAGSGNGNDANNPSGYPAMFVHPKTFDFTQDGYFEYELWQADISKTRFGIYFDYDTPAKGMFLGCDPGGWFWQKYGSDSDYSHPGGKPADKEWIKVRVEWTAEGTFSMYVGDQKLVDNLDSGLEHNPDGKIAVKCGGWNSADLTEVFLRNIYYPGQDTVEGNHITGKVVDEKGTPLSGVQVVTGTTTVETNEDGTYDLEVLDGDYTVSASKDGYVSASIDVTVEGGNVSAEDIVLYSASAFETETLSTADMDVKVAKDFPSIVQYEMKKGDLKDKIFYGQVERLMNIKINGTNIRVNKEDVTSTFTDTKAVYEMALKAENIDCVITAEISVKDNTASFDITNVENNLKDTLDANGYQLYPVQTIEIPNHSLISVNSGQQNAHLKGAKMSTNTRISGDKDFDVTKGMKLSNNAATEDFMYGFISNNEMSAGLWSNSEHEGTHVAAYVSPGASCNTRVIATATDKEDVTTLGLASAMWYYDRRVETDVVVDRVTENGQNKNTVEKRTYVVEHEIMPSAKVAIAGDDNEDGDIDWQDGAVAFRSIMHNPYKSEEVPNLVNYRIAMNFGSHAANPFLMNLDGVKRVYLNTEGLGQSVLLKGYGSEGHDSGHPDYADIGKRIGGAEDMNKLLVEGKKMGAVFGIHVNASEMYTEAKAFSNELSQGNFGWNWIDQGIGINSRYDLATGSRENRFKELKKKIGDNLDFIYVDVWGNATSGWDNEDSWGSRMLAREITGLGWRFATEWGSTQEYDSTLQHWAADWEYGDHRAKGENSVVMRFLRNHQKDSFVLDCPTFDGAAQGPLLGGLNMTDFEGWQGRNDYKKYITVMFRHNVITKYLQHYQVVDWVDGEPVQLASGETWIPEMQVTLRNTKDETDNTELVVTRKSNDYSNRAEYRSRTIKLNDVVISEGAPTGGDGTNPGNEKYLIPWNWDCNGNDLADEDLKMYHWNTKGGTSTWTLTEDWRGLSNVVLYKLTDEGRKDKKVIPVVDNQITLENIEAEIPYVIFKGEKAPLTVDWKTTKHVYDTGFNDPDMETHRTVTGYGTAEIVDSVGSNNMLKLEDKVSVQTTLTNLEVGKKYALYVGVDNRSDSKAHVTVTGVDGKVLGTNYTERSIAVNYVKSDQHRTSYWQYPNSGTVAGSTLSYFQNMYVFFTAEASTALLTFKREAGEGATYFDDIRVVETEMDAIKATDKNGITTVLDNDFENNAQGIWPFVVCDTEGVEDNRIHLSERNGRYTQAGYISKAVDDVLDGNWSLKVNGLSQRNNLIYQTIPQNFRFQPGEEYSVSFDYQMGGDGVYEVRLGDGSNRNVESWDLTAAIGETKRFSFTFTADSENAQNWIGIFSTQQPSETGGFSGSLLDFSGYKDFILDNIRIEKATMKINRTSAEVDSAEEIIPLAVSFREDIDPNTNVVWTSSDEEVARVNGDGEVYFVGFGTAKITATANIDGVDVSVFCYVKLRDSDFKVATFTDVWANTEEAAGEDGRAVNVTDRNSATFWHSNWAGAGFTVAEDNPAIITVKFKEDFTEFENVAFRQRSAANGLIKKYECIVGDSYNEDTFTIGGTNGTDRFTTGTVTSTHSGSGETEVLNLPEGTKGHYLQIRVLQGSGNFACMADILMDSLVSFDTPEERAIMQANKDELARQEEQAASLRNELKEAIAAAAVIYEAGEGNYSAVTWEAFEEAYKSAVAGQDATGLKKLQQLKTNLVTSQEKLKVLTDDEKELDSNQNALKKAVAAAKAVLDAGKGNYTEATWRAFEEAYDSAKSGQSSTSNTTLIRLKKELEEAQANLRETTSSGLDEEVQDAQGELRKAVRLAKVVLDKGKGNYTSASWGAFEAAYDAAKAGENSVSITTLTRLKAELETAQANLTEVTEPGVDEQVTEAQNALQEAIDAAKAVIEAGRGNYTVASWGTFEEAYDAAKAGLTSTSVTRLTRLKAELTQAQADLREISGEDTEIAQAQAALKDAIDAAKPVIEAGIGSYTVESWRAFEEAYDAAKAGLTSTSLTTLNRLKTDLANAQKNLTEETGSDTEVAQAQRALKDEVDAAKTVIDAGRGNYTSASWRVFEEAYDAARAGLTSTSVTTLTRLKTELADAKKNLTESSGSGSDAQVTEALKALKEKVDAAKVIIDAGRGNYTTASWRVFEEAYDAANAGLSSTSITTLTRLKAELEAAQAGLTEGSGSDTQITEAQNALKQAIEAAKPLIEAGKKNYTDKSWEAFEFAYDTARAGETSTSVTTLTRLKTELETAQKNLEESDDNDVKKQLEAARDELLAVIELAEPIFDEGMKNYTTSSWEEFESAYTSSLTARKTGVFPS